MLLETLKALINAGRDALQTTCSLPVRSESVSQLSRGNLTFPALADIAMTGGSLRRVHMGCDSLLCGRLAELADVGEHDSGLSVLTTSFLDQLVEEVPGRNPRGSVASLAVEPLTVRTRGIRTFGFRFETTAGQLFLLAEVPSRAEWERERGGEFLRVMSDSYLPESWAARDHLAGPTTVESFLVFLRKTELDVELQVPGLDRADGARSTFLVEQCHFGDERALKFALEGADDTRSGLLPGSDVAARVGLDERSLEFRLRYLGASSYPVGGDADLDCALFAVPDVISVTQRRQSFRIPLEDEVVAELSAPAPPRRGGLAGPARSVTGRIADLSFSGARITIDAAQPESCFEDGDLVHCRFHIGGGRPVEIVATVRRSVTTLTEGAWPREELGLEFVAAPSRDSEALDTIRDFVLEEQRAWLARRIQVAGVDDW